MPLNVPDNQNQLLRRLFFCDCKKKKSSLRALSLLALDFSPQKLVRNQVRLPHV